MISLKSHYGLRAMVALAKVYGMCTLQAKEIAEQNNIPKRYLDLLFSKLKRAGLVDAKRGKKGGYFLTKSPREISVLDVVRALETDDFFINVGKVSEHELDSFWIDLDGEVKDSMGKRLSVLVPKIKKK